VRRQHSGHIKSGSFASVVRAYITSAKFDSLAANTRKSYWYLLGLAERPDTLGAYPAHVVRPALVQAFLDGLADRPATRHKARAALKAVERWALVRDLIAYPFTVGTEAPETDGGHEPWTDEHIVLAEAHARLDLARAITLAANTGQRGGDIVRMRWSDIEEVDGRPGINVMQQKTGLKLWIPFTQDLIQAMAGWERRPTFILLRAVDGMPWSREQLSNNWLRERSTNPALAPLDAVGCVLHGLRATAVVRLRRAGATTGQIKDCVGMSEQMVNRYCRKSVQRENALAAVHYLDRTQIERNRKSSSETGRK
jgi:integrase